MCPPEIVLRVGGSIRTRLGRVRDVLNQGQQQAESSPPPPRMTEEEKAERREAALRAAESRTKRWDKKLNKGKHATQLREATNEVSGASWVGPE